MPQIGDFCRDDNDCRSDFALIDNDLRCINGLCAEASTGVVPRVPQRPPTPSPIRPLIPVNCCVDDGTGQCGSDCISYDTVDGLCPTIGEGDNFTLTLGFGGLTLIPCDPFRTPPPVAPTPPPTITTPPPVIVVSPPVDVGTESVPVFCGPTSGFEECQRYDVLITRNSDTSPSRLCSLVSLNIGRTVVPCDPQRPATPPPTAPPPVTPPPVTVPTPAPVTVPTPPPTQGQTPPPTAPPTPPPIFVTPPPVAPTPPPVTPPPVAPQTWRSCIDGELYEGSPPQGYKISTYRRAGGGVCWEPSTEVGFNPSPDKANFIYQRGSSNFPNPFEFEVENPSFGVSYKINFETNSDYFNVTPREIRLEPQSKKQINVEVRRDRLENLGDGLTNFNLRVDIEEI
jgi:hypothetical protein